MTVAELKKGIALLDETKDNMIIHVVQGYEGNYLILEKTLDCAFKSLFFFYCLELFHKMIYFYNRHIMSS